MSLPSKPMRCFLCSEALSVATHVSNLQVVEYDGNTLTRYKHFFEETP